jgi:hypothetical protein
VDSEFGQLDGGLSYGAGAGYHFSEAWGLKQADLRADWLHSDHEAGDTVLNRYDELLSATLQLQDGRWGLVTEAYYGTGENARMCLVASSSPPGTCCRKSSNWSAATASPSEMALTA